VRLIGTVGGDSLEIAIAGERLAVTLEQLASSAGALGALFP
jgi:hypothetical protein